MELKTVKKEEIKRLLKPLLVLFLISFLAINWNDISWIFNYKVISGIVSNYLPKGYPKISSASNANEENRAGLIAFDYSDKENSLEIPKIGILAPLIFSESSDEDDLEKELKNGVVHFPTSVLPGEKGQTIILGHSAPSNWPKINYDWVFSNLNALNEDDEVFIHFDHRKYTYYVTKKTFLDRGEEISRADLTDYDNMLVLLSCWPPGKDLKRIAVWAISS